MAFRCQLCGKGPRSGKSVSHSHKASNRFFYPNISKKRILLAGTPRRVYICSSCLKSGKARF